MKTIHVVAAIIIDSNRRIFATQRGYGDYKDWWEFPGGKIEDNETEENALIREIHEELNSTIQVKELFDTVEYDYEKFHLSMKCFICELVDGELELLEHEDAKWLSKDELDSVKWLKADLGIITKLKSYL